MEPVTGTKLRGVGGTIPIIGKGTMVLHIIDDKGKEQCLKVHDAYYAPRLKMRLFCPQQWSRQGPIRDDGSYRRRETTSGGRTRLRFPGGRKTIQHDPKSGLPIMYTKRNQTEFAHYVQSQSMTTYEARVRPTQLQIRELEEIDPALLTPNHVNTPQQINDPMIPLANTPKKSLNFDETMGTTSQLLSELTEKDKRSLLLRWHYRLGHLPFTSIIALARKV